MKSHFKNYLPSFFVGVVAGLFVVFAPEFIGFLNFIPNFTIWFTRNLLLAAIPYFLMSLPLLLIYTLSSSYRRKLVSRPKKLPFILFSLLSFSVGFLCAYTAFLILVAIAISQWTLF